MTLRKTNQESPVSEICKKCRHYSKVSWNYNNFGCSLAITKEGSGGYGPFYSHAVCIFDENKRELKPLFEPTSGEELHAMKQLLAKKDEAIYTLKNDIEKLENSIIKISKGQK